MQRKKTLDDYLKQLNKIIFGNKGKGDDIDNDNIILTQKDIQQIIKFIEKNKKTFSCYEKNMTYLKCAQCMMKYDPYLSYDYLELALKYTENRNYYFEKLTLYSSSVFAKLLRSEARMQSIGNKFRAFWERYFPNQKDFVNLLLKEYKIIS